MDTWTLFHPFTSPVVYDECSGAPPSEAFIVQIHAAVNLSLGLCFFTPETETLRRIAGRLFSWPEVVVELEV